MANATPLATKKAILQGQVNLLGASLRALLVDAGQWTPNLTTLTFVSDVTAAAIVARSDVLTNPTLDTSTGVCIFDADDAVCHAVPSASPTAEIVLLVADTGTDSTSRVLDYKDTDSSGVALSRSFTGDDVLVQWASGGILVL